MGSVVAKENTDHRDSVKLGWITKQPKNKGGYFSNTRASDEISPTRATVPKIEVIDGDYKPKRPASGYAGNKRRGGTMSRVGPMLSRNDSMQSGLNPRAKTSGRDTNVHTRGGTPSDT